MEEYINMINLQDKNCCPTVTQINEYIGNPIFTQFCSEIKDTYECKEKVEYSSCSWEKGWNIKFKKAGKTLCTVYPRENYFTVLIVIGIKEKTLVEAILPECTVELSDIYHQTKEGNGQRWLMIDLEDKEDMYNDVLRLIEIRRNC